MSNKITENEAADIAILIHKCKKAIKKQKEAEQNFINAALSIKIKK